MPSPFSDKLFAPQVAQPFKPHGSKPTSSLLDNVVLTQTTRKSLKKIISETITFTSSLIAHDIHKFSLLSQLSFVDSFHIFNTFKYSIPDSINLTSILNKRVIYSKSLSQNLTFSISTAPSFLRHSFSKQDTLTLSQILTTHLFHIQSLHDTLSFVSKVVKEWERIPTQVITLNQILSSKVIHTTNIPNIIGFSQIILVGLISKQNIHDTILFSSTILYIKVHISSLNQSISFTNTLVKHLIHNESLIQNIIFSSNLLNKNSIYKSEPVDNFNLTQNLSKTLVSGQFLSSLFVPVDHVLFNLISKEPIVLFDDALGGGVNVKSEPKNCFEVSEQCHAEGLETTAGLSFPCTIINGQSALIQNYIDSDFFPNCKVGFYNLNGGNGITEFETHVNSVSLVNDTDTLITFSSVITNHTQGLISLLDDWASHSEGYSTVASGKYSHAGGLGAVADLPSKFARSDNPDSQYSIISLSGTTHDATLTPLTINGTPFRIRNNRTYTLFIHVGGRNIDGTEHAYFVRQGMIHNESGSLALVGSIQTIGTDINAQDWAIAITYTNILKISVQGHAGKTIKWFAKVDCLEL